MELRTSAGVLNITISEHVPEKYKTLFNKAFKLKQPVHLKGTNWAILSSQSSTSNFKKAKIQPLTGDVFKYTQINTDADWFNIETSDFATEEELKEVSIPEKFKPNSTRFTYYFFPDSHILVYEAYTKGAELTPNTAVDFFRKLLNSSELTEEFGEVIVTHFPEKEAVQEALQLTNKRTITMIINNPNAFNAIEKKYLQKVNKRKIAKVETKVTAKKGDSIELDEELENEAKIAANNGELIVKGTDAAGQRKVITTTNRPYVQTDYFDNKFTYVYQAFKNLVITVEEIARKSL